MTKINTENKIYMKNVKKFGNSGHIVLPKGMIGKPIYIIMS